MTPKPKVYTEPFLVLLSKRQHYALTQLAATEDRSMADVLRSALADYWTARIERFGTEAILKVIRAEAATDPRTPTERAADEHAAEVRETQESDRP